MEKEESDEGKIGGNERSRNCFYSFYWEFSKNMDFVFHSAIFYLL